MDRQVRGICAAKDPVVDYRFLATVRHSEVTVEDVGGLT
jgi:hypothetical protein